MLRFARWATLSVALLAIAASTARADEPQTRASESPAPDADAPETDAPDTDADEASEEEAPLEERRPLPDYDGRPERGTDAEDIALWIPRVLFSPLYLVTEYVLRQPIGFVMTELERIRAFRWLHDLFTFGPNREIGIFPTAFWELGFNPSVGVYSYWKGFLIDENRLDLSGATWGSDWLALTVSDRVRPIPLMSVVGRFNAVRRPDQLFGGIGWNAAQSVWTRYAIDSIDASLRVELEPWRRSIIVYEIGYRSASFTSGRFNGDPGVLETGQVPPAFDTGYDAVRAGAELVLDTRELRELTTGGARIAAFAEQNAAFGGVALTRWVRWGGSVLLSTDALGHGRVLSLRGDVGLISRFDGAPEGVIPFTELFDLGGSPAARVTWGPMPGFRPGLARGLSMAVVSASYVWPLWVFLDAHVRLGVGNVFAEYFEDFQADRLALSFDMGVMPRFAGEHPFEILFGLGTTTFGHGTQIYSVRFAVGTRSGL